MKTNILYLPRPASKYPGCFPLHLERHLPRYLHSNNIVHFFAGSSKLGYTIDINPDCKPDLVANVEEHLPFSDNHFGAGLADPPYNEQFAKELYNCEYPKWSKWTAELVRLVKAGGRIGIMQNYIVPRLPNCQYDQIVVILTRIKQYPKIITIQIKE